jgi:hypothetical protein
MGFSHMGMILLDDIKPGMILNNNLKDRSGRILLGEGTEITEKHLRIFKMWGILEADIQGVDRESVVQKAIIPIDPALEKEIEAELSQEFRHTDRQHPFIKELFRVISQRRVRHRLETRRHES